VIVRLLARLEVVLADWRSVIPYLLWWGTGVVSSRLPQSLGAYRPAAGTRP